MFSVIVSEIPEGISPEIYWKDSLGNLPRIHSKNVSWIPFKIPVRILFKKSTIHSEIHKIFQRTSPELFKWIFQNFWWILKETPPIYPRKSLEVFHLVLHKLLLLSENLLAISFQRFLRNFSWDAFRNSY